MNIVYIGAGEDEDRWDTYMETRATSVTDLCAWRRVVRDAYGLSSTFLVATEEDRIVGCLGLYEVKHAIFGHYLATVAFGNDGGFHFGDAATRDALLAEAKATADRLGVEYLLIRTRGEALVGFRVDDHYRTAMINLEGGADAVWKNSLRAKTHNQIRRGMHEGFTVESGHDQRVSFYDVFHEHMRDLGSPAHCMRFYESIVSRLGDRMDFFVVKDGRKLVAGALLCWVNGTAMNLHTVALQKYNRRCPNYLLYWKMIEASCARGCTQFDMGRSEMDGPNLAFKMNWGPQPLTLRYNYYLRTLKDIPSLDPHNPRYRIPIAIWRRLPLFATKSLGPRLITGLI